MKKSFILFFIFFFFHFLNASGQCNLTNASNCKCKDTTNFDCDLLPDITVAIPPLLTNGIMGIIEYPQQCNPPCYANEGLLRITLGTPNIGSGPLTIRSTAIYLCGTDTFFGNPPSLCPDNSVPKQLINQRIYHKSGNLMSYYDRPAGSMTFHPSHGHFHVDDWSDFSLREEGQDPNPLNWPIVGTGRKISFCLSDGVTCTTNPGYCLNGQGDTLTNDSLANYGLGGGGYNCSQFEQGISVGFLDTYFQGLDGMSITIPPETCNGNYWIVVEVDPFNHFLETNKNNNVVAVPVTLAKQNPIPGVAEIVAKKTPFICIGDTTVLSANDGVMLSYLWSTGETTREIEISNAGAYSVTVTSPCAVVTSEPYNVGQREIPPPGVISDTLCAPGQALLVADGNGMIQWYDSLNISNLLFTGPVFQTPYISATTKFYVNNEQSFIGDIYYMTPADNTFGLGGISNDQYSYLTFTAYHYCILESVKVYASGAGNRTIQLRDGSNNVLQQTTVNLPDGESRLLLNFNIVPGNFRLGIGSANPMLFRNYTQTQFPYKLKGYLDITSSSSGTDEYIYFYEWKIKEPDQACASLKVPVSAVIDDCINEQTVALDNLVHFLINPSANTLEIFFTSEIHLNNVIIDIFDLTGRLVYSKNTKNYVWYFKEIINTKNFRNGIYLARVTIDNSNLKKKVLIQ